MPALPTGTVTLLFTAIAGSTQLLQQRGARHCDVLAEYRTLLRSIFTQHAGHEVHTQGDSFSVAFPCALDAVATTVEIRRALPLHDRPDGITLATRIGCTPASRSGLKKVMSDWTCTDRRMTEHTAGDQGGPRPRGPMPVLLRQGASASRMLRWRQPATLGSKDPWSATRLRRCRSAHPPGAAGSVKTTRP
jgi:hypothetical protein